MLSRVADNLYWMSRYLERAEHTARVMGVHLNLMLEHDPGSQGRALGARPRLSSASTSRSWGDVSRRPSATLWRRSSTPSPPPARTPGRCAKQISSEMWEELNRLFHESKRIGDARSFWNSRPTSCCSP